MSTAAARQLIDPDRVLNWSAERGGDSRARREKPTDRATVRRAVVLGLAAAGAAALAARLTARD
ncbi:hypothetical protein [Pengzhenrongella sicca]|uniref:Uncharacterized protein n=1 Tax=Pengzhenrongella sicca TaxID=2819238 RepID=A0A8A4ZAA4_9MICO|nr:hypothetical protein [Pengzhenrongella sicca]QTE27959.1 hypothetical protein J4E96_11120 [Pengzhenrongella sicca]